MNRGAFAPAEDQAAREGRVLGVVLYDGALLENPSYILYADIPLKHPLHRMDAEYQISALQIHLSKAFYLLDYL